MWPRRKVERALHEVAHGRFERTLSGLTAALAVVTGAEVYLEHYRGSFGNKWMWSPVLLSPPLVVAGIGGVFSRRWARTALPVTAGLYAANGLLGEYFHARGVARKPGGWRLWTYNLRGEITSESSLTSQYCTDPPDYEICAPCCYPDIEIILRATTQGNRIRRVSSM